MRPQIVLRGGVGTILAIDPRTRAPFRAHVEVALWRRRAGRIVRRLRGTWRAAYRLRTLAARTREFNPLRVSVRHRAAHYGPDRARVAVAVEALRLRCLYPVSYGCCPKCGEQLIPYLHRCDCGWNSTAYPARRGGA